MNDLSDHTLGNLIYMERAFRRGIKTTDPAIFGQQVREMKRDLKVVQTEIKRREAKQSP